MKEKNSVVIAAAGIGKRMNTGICKQIIEIAGKPILHYSIAAFELCDLIDEIIIVTNNTIIAQVRNIVQQFNYRKVTAVIEGGAERQDSVMNALNHLSIDHPKIVLVHDAVRPFIKVKFINEIINKALKYGSAIPAIKPKDTIKYTEDNICFDNTIDRSKYRLIQTPQAFEFNLLLEAYKNAYSSGFYGTDDASLVENLKIKPVIFDGLEENIKITTPYDLRLAEYLVDNFNYIE